MKYLKPLIPTLATILTIYLLQTKFGDIPPLGRFLNPIDGFWLNAQNDKKQTSENLVINGLQNDVTIKFDENRIPHIFAKNDHDLYLAQGYITARDRLWEMDIQTRQAAGKLSEVFGPKTLKTDLNQRRMGMVFAAENTLQRIMQDPPVKEAVLAYTEGVNCYIDQLSTKDYPIEFKLLNYKPTRWSPINCALLLKLFAQTLSGTSDQFAMTNNLRHFGAKKINNLFSDHPFFDEPIIPAGNKWIFKSLPLPAPNTSAEEVPPNIPTKTKSENIGSNNWAISGSKSISGYPILANDPHLDLTYPSIWYQIQLSSPTNNVYGVSIPGSPMVIIGYNQQSSWGVTNLRAAVLDWYKIKFKDAHKNNYWYNNQWCSVTKRIEAIKILNASTIYDTVIYTRHGPIVYDSERKQKDAGRRSIPMGHALRWVAHDGSDEFMAFYLLNRAKSYDDYKNALKYYASPAQNFIYAGADKNISITVNGKFPIKYRDQGKYILDGSNPQDDWHGWIPNDQNPTIKNPLRNFVSSANQSPTDSLYPYYLSWRPLASYERGKRINNRLSLMKNATVDSMRILQNDTYSIHAANVLPTMIKYLNTAALDKNELASLAVLKKWNKRFDAAEVGATIFEMWWEHFDKQTWDDEFDLDSIFLSIPNRDQTVRLLLTEPNSKWFDNIHTPGIESCKEILTQSFKASFKDNTTVFGNFGNNWRWGIVKNEQIMSLTGIESFGSGPFISGGSSAVINALQGGVGPSWKMIVELGKEVKGYGVYPGGQSGNPGSFYYDNMFNTWKEGKLYDLLFLTSPEQKSDHIMATLLLNKQK